MKANETGAEDGHTPRDAPLAVVEEHVEQENQHDLEGIMATFGSDAWYDDESWGEHHDGRDGVRAHYEDLLRALPDLHIEVHQRHQATENVLLEVVISGTHAGPWRGLPATGRHVEFSLCAVYSFDTDGKLAGERIYYDRATVLRQLGIFREPDRGLGRLLTPLTHPVTIARAVLRAVRG